MSNCYRDDGTGTEDWGVTRITDQITAWPGLGCGPDPLADFGRECQHGNLRRACNVCEVLAERTALESRLRTTAEALTAVVERIGMSHDDQCSFMLASAYRRSAGNPHCDCRTQAILRDARAVLAQLEKEGLA